MSQLFRNRWFALLWMALTVASASFFVGEDGGAAKLLDSAEQIRTERQQLESAALSSPHESANEAEESPMPVLLPADDLNADPLNPKPGDVFIEAVSGQRVRIVGPAVPAPAIPADPQ